MVDNPYHNFGALEGNSNKSIECFRVNVGSKSGNRNHEQVSLQIEGVRSDERPSVGPIRNV
jgi:hypothetical protein